MTKPLDGVRVLDLTRLLPGAYATLLLADLGADVVKVEDPRGGDTMRTMPPLADGRNVYFERLNRNKRSLTLDLRTPDAAAVLDALCARADVVVDSFRPSTARRLGVNPATLRERHPRLICASISGFGQDGPYVERAAHDINYQALAGLLLARPSTRSGRATDRTLVVSPSNHELRLPGPLVGDIGAAMQTAVGILAALLQLARTGVGSIVDVSIHEAAMAWSMFPATSDLLNACYNVYETSDGQWLALGALEPKFWAGFCQRIGRPDLVPLQRAQGEARARVLREVRDVMRSRSREEWLSAFADADVCLTTIYTPEEVGGDPHVVARGKASAVRLPARRSSAHNDRSGGGKPDTTVGLKPATTYEGAAAPALGADTDAVLEAAGIDAAERARLRAKGVL